MLFPPLRPLFFALAAEKVPLISNQHKCDLSVKPPVPDSLPATSSPSPSLPTKQELLSPPQYSEDLIIPVPIMLSITVYHNYILNNIS